MQDLLGADFIGRPVPCGIEQNSKMQLMSLSNSTGGELARCLFVCDIQQSYKMQLMSLSNSPGGKLARGHFVCDIQQSCTM